MELTCRDSVFDVRNAYFWIYSGLWRWSWFVVGVVAVSQPPLLVVKLFAVIGVVILLRGLLLLMVIWVLVPWGFGNDLVGAPGCTRAALFLLKVVL